MAGMNVLRPLLALLLILATGCAAPGAPRAAAPPAAAPAHLEATAIRAGTSGNYMPLSLWNGGNPEGYAPILLETFARAKGIPITWTQFEWPRLLDDFKKGRFDVAADGITVRPERSVAGRFTVPIARGGAVLLVRRPAWAPRTPAGLDPRAALTALDRPALRVVVNRGGHLERVTRSLLHSATITAVADNTPARDALASGEADAAMTNTYEAALWAQGLSGVERLGPLTSDITALWVRADREDLAQQLDTWLLDEEANGGLQALRTKLLAPDSDRTARPVDALIAATAERLALMPAVAAAKRRTGKAVEDAAQEERVIAAGAEAVVKAAARDGAPPPRAELVTAFFRAQIELAKLVQERVRPTDVVPTFSLEEELRPAIARITARMAFLIVRLPPATAVEQVRARAHEDLADLHLDDGELDRLVQAITLLGSARRAGHFKDTD
jgi:cyclohexadienyl dehydratase